MIIDLMHPGNTALRGGPAVFMERLHGALKEKGLWNPETYDTWLNLSFRPIPSEVLQRRPRITTRFDGIWHLAVLPWESPENPSFLTRFAYRWVFNRLLLKNADLSTKLIFQSRYALAMFEKLQNGPVYKPHTVIPNGVDLELFTPSPGSSSRDDGVLRLIVSQRHQASKRAWQIPDIVKVLRSQTRTPVKVTVLGGEGWRNPVPGQLSPLAYLRHRVAQLDLNECFDFIGHVSPWELPEHYRRSHIMLHLSPVDPCPNAVVEALACGLPVIGPTAGGLIELVDRSEWLVDGGEDPMGFYHPFFYGYYPKVDFLTYARRILSVWENLDAASEAARGRAESALDLRSVVDRYIDFLSAPA